MVGSLPPSSYNQSLQAPSLQAKADPRSHYPKTGNTSLDNLLTDSSILVDTVGFSGSSNQSMFNQIHKIETGSNISQGMAALDNWDSLSEEEKNAWYINSGGKKKDIDGGGSSEGSSSSGGSASVSDEQKKTLVKALAREANLKYGTNINLADIDSGKIGEAEVRQTLYEAMGGGKLPKVAASTPSSEQGSSASNGDALVTNLVTGPDGGGSAFHLDAKFNKQLSMQQIVEMVDKMAKKYSDQGKEIEFSNSDVSGKIYNPDASYKEKKTLLEQAFAAHKHSVHADWHSMDYYTPDKGKGRGDSSAEYAKVVVPTFDGGKVKFYNDDPGYGDFSNIYAKPGEYVDADGNDVPVVKVGHGSRSKSTEGERVVNT